MQTDRIAFNPSRCCAGENILALQFDASAGIGILAANGATSWLRFIGSLSARDNSYLDSKFPALWVLHGVQALLYKHCLARSSAVPFFTVFDTKVEDPVSAAKKAKARGRPVFFFNVWCLLRFCSLLATFCFSLLAVCLLLLFSACSFLPVASCFLLAAFCFLFLIFLAFCLLLSAFCFLFPAACDLLSAHCALF